MTASRKDDVDDGQQLSLDPSYIVEDIPQQAHRQAREPVLAG
jgi:hypothetical protein